MKQRFLVLFLLALPASGTIMNVQSNSKWTCSGSGASVTCFQNFSLATSNNDLIAVWTFWQAPNGSGGVFPYTATVSDSPGNNTFYSAVGPTLQTASNTSGQIFYAKKIPVSSGDTITVTFSCPATNPACVSPTISSAGLVIVEYSGLDTVAPLDSVSEAISNSGSPSGYMDSGTASPANANLLVFGGGNIDNSAAPTVGSGFSNVQSNSATNNSSITEQMIVSGNNTLQRATASLSGIATGNWLMHMAVFRGASWTGAQGSSSTRLHGIVDASQFPGSDIGAQVTAAYASLSSIGGRIRVPPNPAGGCWNYMTPIVLSTAGKPALLEGDPGGATCIKFTPSSGNAITIGPGTANGTVTGTPQGAGVRDLTILGACTSSTIGITLVPNCTGVTSQGIVLGPTGAATGSSSLLLFNVKVGIIGAGFLNGYEIGAGSFNNAFINSSAIGNSVGLLADHLSENDHWYGGFLANNIVGASITAAGTDISFALTSFDANSDGTASSCAIKMSANSALTLDDDHFENPGAQGNYSTDCFGDFTAGSVYWHNGLILDDMTSGCQAQWVTFGGNTLVVDGVREFVAGNGMNCVIPQAYNLTNGISNVELHTDDVSGGGVTSEYNIATGARVDFKPLSPSALPAPELPYVLKKYNVFADVYTTNTINPASSGQFRLANTDNICWRNLANNGDNCFNQGGSNLLQYTGSVSFNLANSSLSGLTNGTGLQVFNTTTTCTTGASIGSTCTTAAISLPVGYSDTNYRAICSGLTPTNVPVLVNITKGNTSFTITIAASSAIAASFSSYDCIVAHN